MTPLQLALRMMFQPHMFALFLLEYFEEEDTRRETAQFKNQILTDLQQIRDMFTSQTDPLDRESPQVGNDEPIRYAIKPLDAIKSITFSTDGLTELLHHGGPFRIDNVVLALLSSNHTCEVPISLAELEKLRVVYTSGKINIEFQNANGRFWRSGHRSATTTDRVIELPVSFRGSYAGELDIRSYSKRISVQMTTRRRVDVLDSKPKLLLRKCPLLRLELNIEDSPLLDVLLVIPTNVH